LCIELDSSKSNFGQISISKQLLSF